MSPPCRLCGAPLENTFVDLGMSPLCESYVRPERLDAMEAFYPLHVRICGSCRLVQLPAYVSGEDIFSEYAYFSSYSDSWVQHARTFAETMIDARGLGPDDLVVEVASNDGYLLQHFVARGVPVLGIEPAANVAEAAVAKGVPSLVRFFGARTANDLVADGTQADLLVGNNVLAHVPDLNDFVEGLRILLKPDGVLTMEIPHLLRLIECRQFDTIYHEHYSYFSLLTAEATFARHGLTVVDVEQLATHGGSLRLHVVHAGPGAPDVSGAVDDLRRRECDAGLDSLEGHAGFAAAVEEVKRGLLEFLIAARREGQRVVGYGAPGKGNTLLNYCGVRTDLLEYTVDRNPYKQGLFLPGTHIPVHHPDRIRQDRPDFVLVLPWNLKDEIVQQLSFVHSWGGRFVVPIPAIEVI